MTEDEWYTNNWDPIRQEKDPWKEGEKEEEDEKEKKDSIYSKGEKRGRNPFEDWKVELWPFH